MLRVIIGNTFLGLLDVSVGTFIVYIAGIITGETFNFFQYIAGAYLAFSPDTDVLYMYLRKGYVYTNHHEFFTHRLILGIPICFLACWAIGGIVWGIIGSICILWHYIHDTEDLLGGGIALFWPFSRNYHSFKRTISPEQSTMNKDHVIALETVVFQPSKKVVIETLISAILLVVVVGDTISYVTGVTIAGLIWLSLVFSWIIFGKTKRT